jgi:hypothetical protein
MSKSTLHLGLIYAALILLISSSAYSQKVRLRSAINPDCGVNSNLKFADIYADGNIAVQGTYACRGVFIYDISNPDAPVLASWYNPSIPGGSTKLQFLEAIVVGNRGYFGIGGPSGGVHIVDLTDPQHPLLLGIVDSTHGNGHETVHEMLVWGKYLIENYNSTAEKRIKIIDVSNPAAPVLKWEFSPADNGWIHNMHIRGNRMFTSEYVGSKVEIYDIGNLDTQAPQLLGAVQSDSTNHSTWTSEDGNYLYSCRETVDGDLRVYDVHDPSQPLLIKAIKAKDLGLNAISPHNPVVMGNKLYVSWYQAGLQVFDISNPANPVRLGQYDTYQPAFNAEAAKSSLLEEPENAICGFSAIQNSLPNTYDGMWAVYPFLGENKILTGDLASGLAIVDVTNASQPLKNRVSDFDGDGHTDLSVYSPSSGTWSIEQSSNSTLAAASWGASGDLVEPGDFDGDGKADVAVWRPSNGTWYIAKSTGGYAIVNWGTQTDVPVPADYDADGKTDIAVWRPSTGTWYILRSTLGLEVLNWGTAGDKPLTGDYDGDGKPDIGIWRPSSGTWYIIESSSSQVIVQNWGIASDKPVVADFDKDGISDIGVFRPSNGTWYVINSASGSFTIVQFGTVGDIPVPADYDGDSKADISVYRPSTNTWYTLNSTNGAFTGRNFGNSNDTSVPSSAQPF